MAYITDNPLDDFSKSDDQANHPPNPTGIISPPLFYTKCPKRPNKKAHFKPLPKRKQYLHYQTNHISNLHPPLVQNPPIPNYSNVNTNPDDYHIDNTPVNTDFDSSVKIYSKTNYPFPPPSF